MKHNSRLFLFFFLFLTGGCALFEKSASVTNINCDEKDLANIRTSLQETHKKVIQCLLDHKRTNDAENFKNIIESDSIKLLCEPGRQNAVVTSDSPESKYFPSLKFNLLKWNKSGVTKKNESELFRESIRWLSYRSHQDTDLASIAEMCCLNHGDKALNKIGNEACRLFKYQKNETLKLPYISEYARILTAFGRPHTAVRAAIFAAAATQRNTMNADEKLIYAPLLASIEEINSGNLKKNMSRQEVKKKADSPAVIYGLILGRIVHKSTDEKLLRRSLNITGTLAGRFYPNSIDAEKLRYFMDISEAIRAVLLKNPEALTQAWSSLKVRAEYLCRDLKKYELDAIGDLLNDSGAYLFDLKNRISAGDFYEMATYWESPCDIHMSMEKSDN